MEAIASRLEAIASRLEAIASRLEAIASRLEAIASGLEAIASRLEAIASHAHGRGHCDADAALDARCNAFLFWLSCSLFFPFSFRCLFPHLSGEGC